MSSLTCLVDEVLVLSPRGIWRHSHGTDRNGVDTLGPLLLELRSSEVSALWWKNVIVATQRVYYRWIDTAAG
jgi:hypothetical protein